jgi:hypothetical protein
VKTKFNTDTTENQICTTYQPSYDKPITKNAAPIILHAMTDVQGLDRAYALDNGICIRNATMFVSGNKDFPQDHRGDLKIQFKLRIKY